MSEDNGETLLSGLGNLKEEPAISYPVKLTFSIETKRQELRNYSHEHFLGTHLLQPK